MKVGSSNDPTSLMSEEPGAESASPMSRERARESGPLMSEPPATANCRLQPRTDMPTLTQGKPREAPRSTEPAAQGKDSLEHFGDLLGMAAVVGAGFETAAKSAGTVAAAGQLGASIPKLAANASKASPYLTAAGAGIAAVQQHSKSTAATGTGRLLDAGAMAATSVMVGKNPLIALADIATNGEVSKLVHGGMTAIGGINETVAHTVGGLLSGQGLETAVVNAESATLERFSRAAKAGEHGVVLKAATELSAEDAVDYWEDHTIGDAARDLLAALKD